MTATNVRNRARFTAARWIIASALVLAAPAGARESSYAQLERGRYLVTAGDCIACHTASGGEAFAGNRPIETPFGIIYSRNITPDRHTGIGAWSDDDFFRAMTRGVAPDGTRLYPAFPYPYFARVTREDLRDIKAYLDTLEPVRTRPIPNELPWPLGIRFLMRGWNLLFLDEGVFRPDPEKSAEWNRGAYLVEGLGHCGACHTPKNMLGADKGDRQLQGGIIQDWFAANLSGDLRSGLGSWTADDIVQFLKTGRNRHSAAYGPMAEVITNSTSKLTDADLAAIATYLKEQPTPEAEEPVEPAEAMMSAGEAIFADQCSACHQAGGGGVPTMFAPLKGSAIAQSREPTTVIRAILNGVRAAPTDSAPTPFSMPAFGWKLSDPEVAAVATYVRNAWGNAASPVSADEVADLRERLQAKAE
jgi:mono/diheme cytochrome c family protein